MYILPLWCLGSRQGLHTFKTADLRVPNLERLQRRRLGQGCIMLCHNIRMVWHRYNSITKLPINPELYNSGLYGNSVSQACGSILRTLALPRLTDKCHLTRLPMETRRAVAPGILRLSMNLVSGSSNPARESCVQDTPAANGSGADEKRDASNNVEFMLRHCVSAMPCAM